MADMEVSYPDYRAVSVDAGVQTSIYDWGASPSFIIREPIGSAHAVALFEKMVNEEKVIVRGAPTTGDALYLVIRISPTSHKYLGEWVEIEFVYAGKLGEG